MPFRLRHATDEDAIAIADLFFASYRLLTFFPMLHTIEEYRRFVAGVMLKECAVAVVKDDTGIVAFLGAARRRSAATLRAARPHRPRSGNSADRRGKVERRRGPRALVLSDHCPCTALLRG